MEDFIDDGLSNSRINAFDKRHGQSIGLNGWILYQDGALREANPYGALQEPPEDPWERAKKIVVFHRFVFERTLKVFDEAKQGYRIMVSANLRNHVCGPAPAMDEAVAELKQLRNAAKRAKDNFDKAQAAADAARPHEDRMRERMNQENRSENEDLLTAIDKIEL